jgi:streptogramin lyase
LEARCLLSGNPSISEFPVPTAGSDPAGIAVGPDGNLWFTESFTNQIGRITPAGVVTEFPVPAPNGNPDQITAGPDGNLWFTELNSLEIYQITPAGVVTGFPIYSTSSAVGITAGPDKNLWFTDTNTNSIGRITTGGITTEFPIPTASSYPLAITAGPDGNLWFTENDANKIGRITTAGVVTEFSIPTANSSPEGITAGSDGNLWFTENDTNKIGRITTAGVVTEFSIPTANSGPGGITAGPFGNLWFTEGGANQIGRINGLGVVTEFPVPTASSGPDGITTGPDGNFWFTEITGNQIGRLDPQLTAQGTTVNASEGLPFYGVVATFGDGDASDHASDYVASILWGDGTASACQVLESFPGVFDVIGSHTYAEEGGGYPLSIQILDADGSATTVSSTANVAQMPLLAVAAPVSATEGQPVPAGTIVATFTDTGGADPTSDYSAAILWGDGTPPVEGIVQLSGANFVVTSALAHTYAEEGNYTVQVTIQDEDPANPRAIGGTTFAMGSASVADAPLTPVSVPVLASQPKGTPLSGVTVASFTDGNPTAPIGDFTATIDWGDGSPTTIGTIAQPGGAGTAFVVTGNHTYVIDRSLPYMITVTISDQAGRRLTATTTATVADAPPLASGIPVSMSKGHAFTAPVAYILENTGLPPDPAGEYTATINWGDGTTTTAGTIEAIPGGNWVVGSHTYTGSGPFKITVTVQDDGGFTVTTTTTAFDPPGVPAGPLHHGHGRTARRPRRLPFSAADRPAGSGHIRRPITRPPLANH